MPQDKNAELEKDEQVLPEDRAPSDPEDELIPDPDAGEDEAEQTEESAGFSRRSKDAKWYVVHTYSGHENKVKVNIEKLVENRGMQDLVLSVIVPTEDRVELKDGQRKIKTRKMFPGYVIVKMIVTNESWYLVRNTQGVTGFVGHGSEPIPLTDEEVRRMGIEKTIIVLDIDVGDTVKVISGPFKGFMSVVEEVNVDKQTLRARVSMFGRDTLVELEYDQVDKV
ncbi:MAG: transcription termination/antitermination factor NusG [Clostridiales bacterium]|jgi:transcriptional antiterminator NusG|nr:transcription termination/antitermination factor NusG [Clostridiales bacterium]